jgi:7,8-dihydro-6-hydroxymethylpterin-pyrophosphokinase
MLAYEASQSLYDKLKLPQSALMERNFVCGSIAKIANVFVIYPFTTLRTRIIQNQFVKANPN